MANTQAMCTSFKTELLTATHNFGTAPVRATGASDTFYGALYLASATLNAGTTAYSSTGEVTGTGYTPGGVVVTNSVAPTSSGTTAYWTPSASLVYTSVTLTTAFDTVLIYNQTQSNKAVSVHTFGSQTITAGTFTLTMPANTSTTALLRLA
jgi:hypothetical protein